MSAQTLTRPPMSRRAKLLAFGPALLTAGIVALVASGAAIVPGATAATSGAIAVTGAVDPSLAINITSCPSTTLALGNTWSGSGGMSNACTLNIAANSRAQIMYKSTYASAEPFCNDPAGATTRTCTADLDNIANVAATGSAVTADTMGLALVGATDAGGGQVPAAGAGVGAILGSGTSTAGSLVWAPIPASGAAAVELCSTAAPSSGLGSDCMVKVAAQGETGQNAGAYEGGVNFQVQAY